MRTVDSLFEKFRILKINITHAIEEENEKLRGIW
jgi:hypothetical protein